LGAERYRKYIPVGLRNPGGRSSYCCRERKAGEKKSKEKRLSEGKPWKNRGSKQSWSPMREREKKSLRKGASALKVCAD